MRSWHIDEPALEAAPEQQLLRNTERLTAVFAALVAARCCVSFGLSAAAASASFASGLIQCSSEGSGVQWPAWEECARSVRMLVICTSGVCMFCGSGALERMDALSSAP
jgi:hypothetical protein